MSLSVYKNYNSACAICWENIILHSHPEIKISFKFIPKILMSKECIHFFGPLCILPISSSWNFCKRLVQKLTEFQVISVNIRNSALHVIQSISYEHCQCSTERLCNSLEHWGLFDRAPSTPYTRPTQRLSRPPPIQKLSAENHMLQLYIWCSWWWAYVPKTCRAKNTLIKLPCCIKLAFQIISA